MYGGKNVIEVGCLKDSCEIPVASEKLGVEECEEQACATRSTTGRIRLRDCDIFEICEGSSKRLGKEARTKG